jgi:2-desacetyl-2-hydroxyethyl bacteriochlorophyllide A dehydrogenase
LKAQAVVFTAPNTVEFQQVDCPDPGPGDVVVRVTHSWISNGTEGSFLRGERIAGDTAYRPGDPWPFPIVAGYQKIGVVEWVGGDVTDVAVGETVFAAMGKVNGMFMPLGGQLSPSVSSRSQIWKLPQGVDPLAFSGLVLTQVGYNCGTRAPIDIGQNAVVLGDGMVGQWAAQTLAWRGARVVLVGRHTYRLDLFSTGPMRHTVNAREQDWLAAVRRLLPGGIQVAVDTVGSLPSVEQMLPLMARFGHIVSAGFMGIQDLLSLQPLRAAELSVDLVSGWTQDRMDRTRDLIAADHLQTLPLITHRFPAARAADAWRLIAAKDEPVLGVLLDW